MPKADRKLPFRHALALGLLQGPTELLPVSSSAHTTLIPWLAGWPYAELDARTRKSFEVALHAGATAALLLRPPGIERSAGVKFLAPAVIPAAFTGYALGGQIERRFGTPATIAAGILAGTGALLVGEISAARGRGRKAPQQGELSAARKRHEEVSRQGAPMADQGLGASERRAGARDGLALGLAQALALIPGISRSGSSIAAARTRGFSRLQADRLSWTAGLPVTAGATLLQSRRLARSDAPTGLPLRLAAGATAAFLSTLFAARLLNPARRAALLPACAIYRGTLALFVIRRMRRASPHARRMDRPDV